MENNTVDEMKVNTDALDNNVNVETTNQVKIPETKNKTLPLILGMIAIVIVAAVIIIVIIIGAGKGKKDTSGEGITHYEEPVQNKVSLTAYNGQIYDGLNVSSSFYNVIDATPLIDTRVLSGGYSDSINGWVFNCDFERDYGAPTSWSGESQWTYKVTDQLYTGVYVDLQTMMHNMLTVQIFVESDIYPSGYALLQDDETSSALFAALCGNNMIGADDLYGDYSNMTYSEVVEKFGSIGFMEFFHYYNTTNSGYIRILWFCPEENKLLELNFDTETEVVTESKVFGSTHVEKEMTEEEKTYQYLKDAGYSEEEIEEYKRQEEQQSLRESNDDILNYIEENYDFNVIFSDLVDAGASFEWTYIGSDLNSVFNLCLEVDNLNSIHNYEEAEQVFARLDETIRPIIEEAKANTGKTESISLSFFCYIDKFNSYQSKVYNY